MAKAGKTRCDINCKAHHVMKVKDGMIANGNIGRTYGIKQLAKTGGK